MLNGETRSLSPVDKVSAVEVNQTTIGNIHNVEVIAVLNLDATNLDSTLILYASAPFQKGTSKRRDSLL